LEELQTWTGESLVEDFDVNSLFAATSSSKPSLVFTDSYLQLNVQSILFDNNDNYDDDNSTSSADTDSVDSDDYGFILRPILAATEETAETNAYALPPNNQTCLESMARLRMIQNRYDLALKILVGSSLYEYVLGIIEFHHLHQLLLNLCAA
jgi:hypothetical protein